MAHIVRGAFRVVCGTSASICLHPQAVLAATLDGNGKDATVQAVDLQDNQIVFAYPREPVRLEAVDPIAFLTELREKAKTAKEAQERFLATPRGQACSQAESARERQMLFARRFIDGG